jgi:hypothetical protein
MKNITFLFLSLFLSNSALAQGFHPIDDGTGSSTKPASSDKTLIKPDSPAVKKIKEEEPDSAADTSIKDEKPQAQPGVTISGVVRAVRGFPVTEVFFKDQKDSYFIDPTSTHDQIMNACLRSSRDGKSVSLRVDPVTRHVYSLSEQNKTSQDQGTESSKMSRPGSN